MADGQTMPLPNPVIFLPGITATNLRDFYPLPPETIWGVLGFSRDYSRASLHPNDLNFGPGQEVRARYEAREPARIVPDQIFEIAYKEPIAELRYNLSNAEDAPVPVYPFGYDWRQPLSLVEAQLDGFIDEVIERTCLMKHYFANGYQNRRKVTLVGHSMGGLIIAGFLAGQAGKPKRVEKVVTLATPFQGSIEAVAKIATGEANLGTDSPSPRERESARVTPALYHLMPSFTNGLTLPAGTTLFDPTIWQKSIKDTIVQYVQLYGTQAPDNAAAVAAAAFAGMLGEADAHRNKVAHLDLDLVGLDPAKDWLCVVGADTDTRVKLSVNPAGPTGPEFRFDPKADILNQWDLPGSLFTGDGTVPLEGAIPPFLNPASVVVLKPDDYGLTEFQDRILAKASGFHGLLPNMNMLHRLMVAFLKHGARGDYWGRPLPGIATAAWTPPIPITHRP